MCRLKTANSWPPENITYQSYYLKKVPTGSVKSLNDGALDILRRLLKQPPNCPDAAHP